MASVVCLRGLRHTGLDLAAVTLFRNQRSAVPSPPGPFIINVGSRASPEDPLGMVRVGSRTLQVLLVSSNLGNQGTVSSCRFSR